MEEKLKDVCRWLREVKGINRIDIIDLVEFLPEYEEWRSTFDKQWTAHGVRCDLCSHEWVAVHNISSVMLECPNCKNMTRI